MQFINNSSTEKFHITKDRYGRAVAWVKLAHRIRPRLRGFKPIVTWSQTCDLPEGLRPYESPEFAGIPWVLAGNARPIGIWKITLHSIAVFLGLIPFCISSSHFTIGLKPFIL